MNHKQLDYIPNDIVCLDDYERYANEMLDINALSYISSGVAKQITYRKNIEAFDNLYLESRPLENLKDANKKLSMFNEQYDTPIMIAPVAHQKLVDKDGEISTAKAANALNTPMVVSSFSNSYVEDISKITNSPLWFQLYIQNNMNDNYELIDKVESLGFKAIMITIDAPISGVRNIEQKAGFTLPENVYPVNIKNLNQIQISNNLENILDIVKNLPTWETIKQIKEYSKLPIILKGITSPSYAKKALEIGVDGIVVSNHGGRTLDTLPASIEILPKISDVIKEEIPIIFDGGVRRGTDVIKAIALGASMVMIGRPIMYALATASALGVAHTLKILNEEFEISMILTGCKNIDEIKNLNV